MALLEGKTSTERNKIIAAAVLGLVAFIALFMAFGPRLSGGSTASATTKGTPTPKPSVAPAANPDKFKLPTADEEALNYTVPVVYTPGSSNAPDAGRNIFAFYEPPVPTPPIPTATPTPVPTPSPTPSPTPGFLLAAVSPSTAYAGVPAVKIDLIGDRFTEDAKIFFDQKPLPTTFVSSQRLTTEIPANLIAQEGFKTVVVRSADGVTQSNPAGFTAQPAPKPTVQYIGMIGRKRYNNDTAYFTETGKPNPYGARLNDTVNGRFRLIDITAAEVVFEDISLGFKHRIKITPAPTGTQGQPNRPGGFPNDGFGNPNVTPGNIPGIPGNMPVYVPPGSSNRDPIQP